MKKDFKIDIALAGDIAVFLEALLHADLCGEFDTDELCDAYDLERFMPNGFIPEADILKALLASGIITAVECKHTDRRTIRTVTRREFVVCNCCNKVI